MSADDAKPRTGMETHTRGDAMAEDTSIGLSATRRQPEDYERAADGTAEFASFESRDDTFGDRLHHFLHANPIAAPLLVLVGSCAVFGVIANNFFSPFN